MCALLAIVPRDGKECFLGNSLNSVAIAPDGKLLITGGRDNVMLWDVQSGDALRRLDVGAIQPINSVAFAADSNRVLIGGAGSLQLWNLETDKSTVVYSDTRDGTRVSARFVCQLAIHTKFYLPKAVSIPETIPPTRIVTRFQYRVRNGSKVTAAIFSLY